jgi:hypothetical protein
LLTDWDEINNFYRGPSIDASYQVSFHLAKRFQRRRFLEIEQFGLAVSEKIFRNQPIRNKNCLWQPCLLMDQDEISNLYRRLHRCFLSSFDSFGQAVSEERRFKKIGQSETRIACGGHVCTQIGTK